MKHLKILFIGMLLSVVGCSMPWDDNPPINDELGDYSYLANITYYNESGTRLTEKQASGSIILGADVISLYPKQGWVYSINFTNVNEHMLSTGEKIITFSIESQEVFISDFRFLIIGQSAYTVTDPNGTVIGQFDGWINENNEINFSCESLNMSARTKTITSFTGTKS
jgi:hypothetical protein